jgi:hypothetical protein
MRRLTAVSALGLTLTVALLLGCGGFRAAQQAAAQQQRANNLKQIGLAYYQFIDTPQNKGKAPTTAADLQPFLGGAAAGGQAAASLTDGSVVFIYGVRAPEDMPLGTSNTVLAYEAAVPAQGGVVLFGDCSVRVVTAAEFSTLKLATSVKDKDDKKGDKKGDKK